MEYIIDSNYENVRIDKFIRKKYKDIPLSHIYRMLRTGKIKINGKKVKESYLLCVGDTIKIYSDDQESKKDFLILSPKERELISKGIVFENEDVIFFNKPAGIPVHKGSGFDYGIIEMAKSYFQNNDVNPVNRIDKLTSGLIILAKHHKSVREYSELLKERKIEKYYFVGVKGIPKEKEYTIISNLEKNETRVDESDDGKESVTKYKLIKTVSGHSLLEAEILTGRTHQIRVQMEKASTPIIGDTKYGEKHKENMLLFSYRIRIHEKNIDFKLDMPESFKKYF